MRSRRSLATALALALVLAVGALGSTVAFGRQHANRVDRPTVVRVDDRSGFDWGDAGIGAIAGFALSMVGVALAVLSSTRSRPST
jgi:hypothetical protein